VTGASNTEERLLSEDSRCSRQLPMSPSLSSDSVDGNPTMRSPEDNRIENFMETVTDQQSSLPWNMMFDGADTMTDTNLSAVQLESSVTYGSNSRNENSNYQEDEDMLELLTSHMCDDGRMMDDASETGNAQRIARPRPEEEGIQLLKPSLIPNSISTMTVIQSSGENTGARTNKGRTALHLAAEQGKTSVVNLLLQRHLDPNLMDSEGRTALHLAVEKNHFELVQMLINLDGKGHAQQANVNASDQQGRTALHIAIIAEQAKMVDLLLCAPSIELEVKDQDGHTALHHASLVGSDAVVNALLAAGADILMPVG
jgi:ankyrin repeat protein